MRKRPYKLGKTTVILSWIQSPNNRGISMAAIPTSNDNIAGNGRA